MGFPPEAYLIGAKKAGTTTLATLLDQHPEIAVSRPKEPDFFSRHWDHGPDWYRARFRGPETAVFLDASVSYAAAIVPGSKENGATTEADGHTPVPERIRQVAPDARFLYSLRDPVARIWSNYWHDVRAGTESRPFREAIGANPEYLSTGDYEAQLRRFLVHFPLERFHLVRFEEIAADAAATAAGCARFLGLDTAGFAPVDEGARNITYQYSDAGRLAMALLPSQELQKAATRAVRTMLPARLQSWVMSVATRRIPPMAEDDRAVLVDHYRPRLERLEALTGFEVHGWAD